MKWERGDPHSNPEKIDDTFPLAFTYSSEPKEASFRKIMKYLIDNYPSVNVDTRFVSFSSIFAGFKHLVKKTKPANLLNI